MEKNNLKIFFIKLISITFSVIIIINIIYNLFLAERIEKKNVIKFFEGVTGSFQLTQAQQQLYQAQQSKIQSMRRVIIEKTNLENILNNKN